MHILPKLEEWSDEFNLAAGIKGWLASQGVYFYRLDRMIQIGGWCGLLNNDEKTKLARLSIDVGREWDQLIELTAVKDRIIVPDTEGKSFRNDFRKIFGKLRGAARRTYEADYGKETEDNGSDSGGGDSGSEEGGNGGGSGTGGTTGGTGTTGRRRRPRRLDDHTVERLLDACENEEERNVVTRAYTRARRGGR